MNPNAEPSLLSFIFNQLYLVCAIGFFVSLKFLASPTKARLGNILGAGAMGLATLLTMIEHPPTDYVGVLLSIVVGSVIGVVFAKKVQMTAMPQLVAIFNGFGGLASVLVALAEMFKYIFGNAGNFSEFFLVTSWMSVVIGAITFTGSVIAYLKLQELIPTKPLMMPGQKFITAAFTLAVFMGAYAVIAAPDALLIWLLVTVVAFFLGVLLVIPIGGADMPVVISLLNSYSGLAAMAAGFVVNSPLLIIAGALVGASGIILTRLMCQAMNRSLTNVVFGAFGNALVQTQTGDDKPLKEFQPIDVALQLKNANQVVIVPGYGLAVSEAQRNLRELVDLIKTFGVKVSYAIHPVAGRMPGHMNVLLAEADVPYEELFDLDSINSEFESTDVVIVVGANDVVNPSARTDKTSPLFGMPILNADKARSVIILKRGRGRGFSGVENPLFTLDNAHVLFGDAKASIVKVINAFKELA